MVISIRLGPIGEVWSVLDEGGCQVGGWVVVVVVVVVGGGGSPRL